MLAVVLGTIATFVAATVTGAAGILNNCDLNSLKPVAIGANSFVYAADGTVLGAIPAERNRQPVALDSMSHWITNATVDVEDRRFYEHGGIDWEGVVRAAVENVKSGHIVQGGSTITQQLVRNLYIGKEVSLDRKIKEACLAQKLEDVHTKDWILASYLNQVYFGNHAYGVEAAAQTYFSKHAADLNLVQAALIAGLPQAPSIYDPFQRPAEAVARRNEVLGAMYSAGDITAEQYQSAVSAPLKLHAGQLYTRIREPYFFSYVREQLIAKYGANTVRGGGLKVYTTIVPRFQKLATQAMQSTLNLKTDPASALVSINPKNGAIRAMTAEIPGKKNNQFNLAAQGRRQAGSSFKTFVLTEAIREGINPDTTMYMSAPFHWQPDPSSEAWDVSTFDGSFYGPSSITQSTLRSDNSVYARLTLDLGPEKIVTLAHQMGIKTKLEPVASIGLGSNSVGVLEMASAYATIAAGGIYSEPMAIRKVVLPSGEVDRGAGWGRVKQKRVFSDGVAYQVARILKMNVQAGTGVGANPGFVAGGKTGTTDDFGDAWFAGITTTASTVVWVGYPNAKIPMTAVHGIRSRAAPSPPRSGASSWSGRSRTTRLRTGRSRATRSCGSRSTASTSSSEHPRRRRSRPTRRSTTTAMATARRRPSRRRPRRRPRRLTRARTPASGAFVWAAGGACLLLLAAALACAWPGDSLLTPDHSDGITRWSWLFLGFLSAAFLAYLAALLLIRSGAPALVPVLAVAAAVQLAPLASPLLLSTDAYTYWDYGRIGAVHGGNPYSDEPSAFPDDPAYARMGANWRDTTTVYGPVFTLASEGHAAVVGDSPGAAAWVYKALGALAMLALTALAAFLGRERAFAAAFVGWNPLLAVHFAGGGHNDAWMMALVLGALALGAVGKRHWAGAAWVGAIAIKWVAVVFLPLRALEARAQGRRVGHLGFAAAAVFVAALASWRYGTGWLEAFGPLAKNLREGAHYSLPSRLSSLGIPHDVAVGLFIALFVLGYLWLLWQAWRGRARLALCADLVLLTTPWLIAWYAVWAVPLAAVEEDRAARLVALGLCAYLLANAVPL